MLCSHVRTTLRVPGPPRSLNAMFHCADGDALARTSAVCIVRLLCHTSDVVECSPAFHAPCQKPASLQVHSLPEGAAEMCAWHPPCERPRMFVSSEWYSFAARRTVGSVRRSRCRWQLPPDASCRASHRATAFARQELLCSPHIRRETPPRSTECYGKHVALLVVQVVHARHGAVWAKHVQIKYV